MKYKMHGLFVSLEDESKTNTLKGKLVGFRVITPDDGPQKIQIDLKTAAEDGTEKVDTLVILRYGDASLKILRCLLGVAEVITGKELSFVMEERENRGSLIHVLADGEELVPMGSPCPYSYEKNLMTDKIVDVLKNVFNFRFAVAVYVNEDKVYPENEWGNLDVDVAAEYIKDLRRSGRSGEIHLTKTVFSSPAAANGYKKALADLSSASSFRVLYDEASIETLMEAYTCEIEAASEMSSEGERSESLEDN